MGAYLMLKAKQQSTIGAAEPTTEPKRELITGMSCYRII